MLKQLRVVLNFKDYTFFMSEHGLTISMNEMPSGHVTFDVLQFHSDGFSVPREARHADMSDFTQNCFLGDTCRLSWTVIETWTPPLNVLPHAFRKAMAALMQRLQHLAGSPTSQTERKKKPMDGTLRSKVAIRGWRVILDKISTLIVFIERQSVVQEWFPQLPVGSPLPQEEEGPSSLESVYAEIIVNAKKLEPLKSKENPKVSASNCVHPKSSLKGGGHRSVSYITRKDCHSRWEKEIKSFPSRRTARW